MTDKITERQNIETTIHTKDISYIPPAGRCQILHSYILNKVPTF